MAVAQLLASSSPARAQAPLIFLDGGFATECERRGLDLNHAMWSTKALLDDPSLVQAVHAAFYDAGSDAVSTATYQASDAGAAQAGTTLQRIATDAVAVARAAADGKAGRKLVAGSVSPLGATLGGGGEYTGEYARSEAEYVAFHQPRIEALLDAGVDVLLLETFPRIDEALAATTAVAAAFAKRVAADATASLPPVSVSFTQAPELDPSGVARTPDGRDMNEALAALAPFPFVRWIGANCCTPVAATALLRHWARDEGASFHRTWLDATATKPFPAQQTEAWRAVPRGVVLYPNSGERWIGNPERPGTGEWDASELPPEEAKVGGRLAAHWPKWKPLLGTLLRLDGDTAAATTPPGSAILGGCCRTYPEDIQGLRRAATAGA